MAKINKMLEKIRKQPSAKNISSKVITASPDNKISIEPSEVLVDDAAYDIARKAGEIDKGMEDIIDVLSEFEKPKTTQTNQVYNKAGRLIDLSKLGKGSIAALKIGAKVAGPLAAASDALASADIGEGEQSEIDQMKKEKLKEKEIQKIFKNDKNKIEEFKRKEEESLRKPISPVDLLKVKSIAPNLSMEEEEPKEEIASTEQDMNYENFLKKMKNKLGYS